MKTPVVTVMRTQGEFLNLRDLKAWDGILTPDQKSALDEIRSDYDQKLIEGIVNNWTDVRQA